jgi:O-antigen/teichoic acid export membrane protein
MWIYFISKYEALEVQDILSTLAFSSTFILSIQIFVLKFIVKKSKHNDQTNDSKKFKEILIDSATLWASQGILAIWSHLIVIFIGGIATPKDVAIYSTVLRACNSINFVILIVNHTLSGWISLWKSENKILEIEFYAQKANLIAGIICTLICSVILFFGERILIVVFGPDYGDGYGVFNILALGYLALSFVGTSGMIMQIVAKGKELLMVTFLPVFLGTLLLMFSGYISNETYLLYFAFIQSIVLVASSMYATLFLKWKYSLRLVPSLNLLLQRDHKS